MKTRIDCHDLVDSIGDAVIASDANGAIMLWNPAAERIFGYTEAEALGQSLDIIIPERLRGRHWDGYDKSMASGTSRYGHDLLRVPATHKNGSAISIAFTVAMLLTADRKVSAIIAVIRDETVRFNDERTLRKRIVELEAKLKGTVTAP